MTTVDSQLPAAVPPEEPYPVRVDVSQGASLSTREDNMKRPELQVVYRGMSFTVPVTDEHGKAAQKDIIKNIEGSFQPGRLTAIMGASGAGKTTLLRCVGGYTSGESGTTKGQVLINGEQVPPARVKLVSAFVHQEDVLLGTMTVREVLTLSAKLRLPKDMTTHDKEARVEEVLDVLGLRKVPESLIGSTLVQGISGGEKRRVSIGMELITDPRILFLDEPTSGLDTFTALTVVQTLKRLALEFGCTVAFTIHQPSSDIFHLFDDLILMADGRILYHGPAEGAVDYFAQRGYPCPTYSNPADFIFMSVLNAAKLKELTHFTDALAEQKQHRALLQQQQQPQQQQQQQQQPQEQQAVSTNPRGSGGGATLTQSQSRRIISSFSEDSKASSNEKARIEGLLTSWTESKEHATLSALIASPHPGGLPSTAIMSHASFFVQFFLLAQRAFRNAWRNKLMIRGRLMQYLFLNTLFGLVYLNIASDQRGIQDRQGSLFFLMVQGIIGSTIGTVTIFGVEKAVFAREYGGGMYSLAPYFYSRILVEIPYKALFPIIGSSISYWMIGYQRIAEKWIIFAVANMLLENTGAAIGIFASCLVSDISVVMAILPMMLMPLMIFSGFFINSANIPAYFNWISYISPVKYAFIAVAKNEFTGLVLHCKPELGQSCPANFPGEMVLTSLSFDEQPSIAMCLLILVALWAGFMLAANFALWASLRSRRK